MEEWSDLPKGGRGRDLYVCVPEGGVTVVEYTISTRVDGDVLKVFWSYCSEVGFIKVWVWNHCRHPGFCEANIAAVPCFSLVWDARPQFAEFVIQWLNVSQQNCWERRSESTASQSDENASSLSSFSASVAFPRLRDPDKGIRCGVCEQSRGIQELKVRFALREGGTNV